MTRLPPGAADAMLAAVALYMAVILVTLATVDAIRERDR